MAMTTTLFVSRDGPKHKVQRRNGRNGTTALRHTSSDKAWRLKMKQLQVTAYNNYNNILANTSKGLAKLN